MADTGVEVAGPAADLFSRLFTNFQFFEEDYLGPTENAEKLEA